MLGKLSRYMLLGTVLSGCAGGKLVGKIPAVENDRFATVHIVRPQRVSGCLGRITIQLNHEDFYYLACGEHLVFKISAEHPLTVSETTSVVPDYHEIHPEEGRQYFFEHECDIGSCSLHETTFHKFKKEVHGCKQIDLSS